MNTRRLPDWPERLAAHIARHRATPFAWGAHDCVGFAFGAVQAITGAAQPLLSWPDKAGAVALLRGFGGLVPGLDALLPRVPLAHVQRGDLLLLKHGARRWLAVCDGAHAWAPAAHGLLPADPAGATHAWGVR